MSANMTNLLHHQIASSAYEQAAKTAQKLTESKSASFTELIALVQHAVNARQPDIAIVLLEGAQCYIAASDAASLQQMIAGMTDVISSCWRLRMDVPARKAVKMVLELMKSVDYPTMQSDDNVVGKFAEWAGRFALRQNDMEWFGAVALQTASWAARGSSAQSRAAFLPVYDLWLHRILRHDRLAAIPVYFEALSILCPSDLDIKCILNGFLQEWRVVSGMACLNIESPMASQLVEQLLLFAIRIKNQGIWSDVSEKIGEVGALAVSKHGIQAGLSVFRPLLDVGRVTLGDELKFGTGTDPDSMRQRIIRLVCNETLRIADIAARGDMQAVSGDKIEEIYRYWASDPQYESQRRSIQRFCQLLLIFWANNRKRAAKKWTPREQALSEPLLLTEEDRAKLVFLL